LQNHLEALTVALWMFLFLDNASLLSRLQKYPKTSSLLC